MSIMRKCRMVAVTSDCLGIGLAAIVDIFPWEEFQCPDRAGQVSREMKMLCDSDWGLH